MTMENASEGSPKDIFHLIGNYGPWQRNVFIIFFIINWIGMWHSFSITFIGPNMEYKCVIPNNISWSGSLFANLSERRLILGKDIAIRTNSVYVAEDQCSFHVVKSSEERNNYSQTLSFPCDKWEYNVSFYSRTIINEWDLVCEKEWLVSLSKSIYMVGFMVSVLVFGQISDCIGRWPTIMVCYVITCVSGLMSAFSSSYLMFIILRFFQAFGRTGMTTTGFVLMMEIIGPKYRTKIGIAIQMGWSMGFMTLPAVAWFVRDWFWFQLATMIPVIPFFIMYWAVPESPRWLMTQRKMEKFREVVNKAAKMNRRPGRCETLSSAEELSSSKLGIEDKVKTNTLLDLFKTPRLRYRTLNCIYQWMVNAFVYYSLSYNTNDLGGDPYLNFFIAGVLEVPSYIVVYYGISRYGRRSVFLVSMMIGGIACAAIIAVPESMPNLATAFAMVGKFCITGSFGILYLYCSELFPTVVRNVAIGSCSTFARVGSILAPFVRELGKATHPSVPNVFYACLAISSGLLALLLPETNNTKIADTLEEGERFGRDVAADREVGGVSSDSEDTSLHSRNTFRLHVNKNGFTKMP